MVPDPLDTTAHEIPAEPLDLDPDAPVTAPRVDLVMVGGKPFDPFAPPPDCEHLSFTQLVEVQNLVDDRGVHVAWRATLKVRCAECGRQMRFVSSPDGVLHTAASEDRRTLGAIIEPVPADEQVDGWPTLGDARPASTSSAPPSVVRSILTGN